MKRLLPLVAVAGLLAACGSNDGYCDNCDHHKKDALSDRSMGNSRGAHNEKLVHPHHAGHVHGDRYVVAPVVPVAPAPGIRPDGTYYVTPVVEDHGRKLQESDDALSDRSLGNSRGSHNQPMTAKDANNDGDYDYVPDYRLRGTTWSYSY